MWSTESGHFVKVVKCHNEVNEDDRKEKETGLYRRLQARSSGAGYGAQGAANNVSSKEDHSQGREYG
jgi:hypothetical protein